MRLWAAAQVGEVADVAQWRDHIEIVRAGQSVYHHPRGYPYLPGWLWVELGSAAIAERLQVPFVTVIRTAIVLGDVAASLALWWAGSQLGRPGRGATVAAVYALSPLAILISGTHGQFDGLVTACTLVAGGLLLGPRPRPVWPGLR